MHAVNSPNIMKEELHACLQQLVMVHDRDSNAISLTDIPRFNMSCS